MSGELGIIAAIAALLAGSSSKFTGSAPELPKGETPGGKVPYPSYPDLPPAVFTPEPPAGGIEFGIPVGKIGIPEVRTAAPVMGMAPGISELTFVRTTPAPAPSILAPAPVQRTTGTIAAQLKTGSWTHFLPPSAGGGTLDSRPPTQEEQDSGLGCPEVPGIWDAAGMNPAYRYCANPNCPSNKAESVVMGGEIQNVPATPAVLYQEVGSDNVVRYFCPVCRTYQ